MEEKIGYILYLLTQALTYSNELQHNQQRKHPHPEPKSPEQKVLLI